MFVSFVGCVYVFVACVVACCALTGALWAEVEEKKRNEEKKNIIQKEKERDRLQEKETNRGSECMYVCVYVYVCMSLKMSKWQPF